jgi:hypothetical protein
MRKGVTPKFVLQDDITFDWPVDVAIPTERVPGTHEQHRFTVKFRALPVEEARALAAEVESTAATADREGRQDAMLQKVVAGWSDVLTPEGAEVPFTPAALERLVAWPWVRLALYRAYADAISGPGQKARRQGN